MYTDISHGRATSGALGGAALAERQVASAACDEPAPQATFSGAAAAGRIGKK
jgi:hypothetical protein